MIDSAIPVCPPGNIQAKSPGKTVIGKTRKFAFHHKDLFGTTAKTMTFTLRAQITASNVGGAACDRTKTIALKRKA